MKQVLIQNYPDKDLSYLLTDKEFFDAQVSWNKQNSYWCDRLEVLLPPKIKLARTPEEDVGYEVFMEKDGDIMRKIFKKDGKYFKRVKDDESFRMVEHLRAKDLLEKELLLQDEYYQEKKYLGLN